MPSAILVLCPQGTVGTGTEKGAVGAGLQA